jgi:hypothetical protein
MFKKTHTTHAPWMVIDANDKKNARIIVLKIILEHIMQVCVEKGIPVIYPHKDVSHAEEA